MTYEYLNRDGVLIKSTNRTTANNEAYWADSTITVRDAKGYVTEVFKPHQIDTSNLICSGFHNNLINNKS